MATSSAVMVRLPFSILLIVADDHWSNLAAASRLSSVCVSRIDLSCAPRARSLACGGFRRSAIAIFPFHIGKPRRAFRTPPSLEQGREGGKMINDELTVTSWVRMDSGCPVRATVIGSAETEFSVGAPPSDFEFVMEADALREFLKVGTQALS